MHCWLSLTFWEQMLLSSAAHFFSSRLWPCARSWGREGEYEVVVDVMGWDGYRRLVGDGSEIAGRG
jgi:hypothetical protein